MLITLFSEEVVRRVVVVAFEVVLVAVIVVVTFLLLVDVLDEPLTAVVDAVVALLHAETRSAVFASSSQDYASYLEKFPLE